MDITFSSKVWLKRFFFFEVFEDFDDTVAFSDSISVMKKTCNQMLTSCYCNYTNVEMYLRDNKPLCTYSEESCAQTNSCADPKLLFLKAMAV